MTELVASSRVVADQKLRKLPTYPVALTVACAQASRMDLGSCITPKRNLCQIILSLLLTETAICFQMAVLAFCSLSRIEGHAQGYWHCHSCVGRKCLCSRVLPPCLAINARIGPCAAIAHWQTALALVGQAKSAFVSLHHSTQRHPRLALPRAHQGVSPSSKPSYKEPRDAAQSVPCCALHRVLAARLGLQCTRESAETHGNQGAFLEVTLWGWVSKGNQENPNGFPLSKHTHNWLALGNPRFLVPNLQPARFSGSPDPS